MRYPRSSVAPSGLAGLYSVEAHVEKKSSVARRPRGAQPALRAAWSRARSRRDCRSLARTSSEVPSSRRLGNTSRRTGLAHHRSTSYFADSTEESSEGSILHGLIFGASVRLIWKRVKVTAMNARVRGHKQSANRLTLILRRHFRRSTVICPNCKKLVSPPEQLVEHFSKCSRPATRATPALEVALLLSKHTRVAA